MHGNNCGLLVAESPVGGICSTGHTADNACSCGDTHRLDEPTGGLVVGVLGTTGWDVCEKLIRQRVGHVATTKITCTLTWAEPFKKTHLWDGCDPAHDRIGAER